ncbi:hypothetical protein LR48_Vigan11g144100 [Vigna angularis]|uniref:Uncharacterized protein n=1 Tax=Phaseolus angularis TaxID=3914 RepID=A0A0L9VU71_PHAAN|nr:hypothetical protein LR48_Vigan11g144100 [Vigna angularis]
MEVGQDSLLDIKKAKKPLDGGENSNNWEKERETVISTEDRVDQDHDGDVVTITSRSRVSEVVVLSVDCFAGIRGQDRREENTCEGEGKDENCDGDIVVATEKVAKVVVFTGDSGVGCGVYVKIVKKGYDRGKKAKYGGNMVTIMAGNKVEDAVVLRLQYNIQRKQLAQHDDDEEIGWLDQQALSFLASRMNKSGQGEGLASVAAIKVQKKFWDWKKRKELLIIH